MSTWIVILAAAAATYLVRISMVVLFDGHAIPAVVQRGLALAAPAVLAAVVASSLATHEGEVQVPDPSALVAVAVAGLVVHRTRKPLHALLVGLPIAWVLSAVL